MAKLTAIKPFVYASRRLVPGDDFHAKTPRDARLLRALGRATDKVSPRDDIAALRAEYEELAGKRPFMGWGEDVLREKIEEMKGATDGDY